MGDGRVSHVRRFDLIKVGLGVVFGLLAFLAIVPVLFGEGNRATKAKGCLSAERELGLGLFLYSEDNSSELPRSEWEAAVFPYVVRNPLPFSSQPPFNDFRQLKCPSLDTNAGSGYALLPGLRNVSALADPTAQVMLFESKIIGWNVVAPFNTVCQPRHNNLLSICFSDGHVKAFSPAGLSQLGPNSIERSRRIAKA